jgi:hypothetical protein
MQRHGTNYFVPVAVNVTMPISDVDVNLVLQQMDPGDSSGGRLNAVILGRPSGPPG